MVGWKGERRIIAQIHRYDSDRSWSTRRKNRHVRLAMPVRRGDMQFIRLYSCHTVQTGLSGLWHWLWEGPTLTALLLSIKACVLTWAIPIPSFHSAVVIGMSESTFQKRNNQHSSLSNNSLAAGTSNVTPKTRTFAQLHSLILMNHNRTVWRNWTRTCKLGLVDTTGSINNPFSFSSLLLFSTQLALASIPNNWIQ